MYSLLLLLQVLCMHYVQDVEWHAMLLCSEHSSLQCPEENHSGRTMDEVYVDAISTADRHVAAVPLLQTQAQVSASTRALPHKAAA